MTGITQSRQPGQGRWRIALWAGAGIALLIPLVAGAPWTGGDYAFAAILLFGALGLYELMARTSGSSAYRAGAGIAITAVLLLLWVNGAVGITDSEADVALGLFVPAVAFLGAILARFRPEGMARTMLAAAVTVGAIAGIALVAGIVPAFNTPSEILAIAGVFAMMFVGSALLFRQAAEEGTSRPAERPLEG